MLKTFKRLQHLRLSHQWRAPPGEVISRVTERIKAVLTGRHISTEMLAADDKVLIGVDLGRTKILAGCLTRNSS
jgi:hypothetical protein